MDALVQAPRTRSMPPLGLELPAVTVQGWVGSVRRLLQEMAVPLETIPLNNNATYVYQGPGPSFPAVSPVVSLAMFGPRHVFSRCERVWEPILVGVAPNEEIHLEVPGNFVVFQEFLPDFVDYVNDAGQSLQQIYVNLKGEEKEMLLNHLDRDLDEVTRTFWEVHSEPEADDLAVLFGGLDLAKDAKKRGWQVSVNADLLEGIDLTVSNNRAEVSKKLKEGRPRILVTCPPSASLRPEERLADTRGPPDPLRQRVRFIKEHVTNSLLQFAVEEAVQQVERGGEVVFEQPSASTAWTSPVVQPLLGRREVQLWSSQLVGFELQARERGKSEKMTWAFTAETADVGQVRGLRPGALRNLLGDVNIRNYLGQAKLNQKFPPEAFFNEWFRKAKAEGSFYEKFDHRPVLVQWRPTAVAETGPKHTKFRTTLAVRKGDWKRKWETIEVFASGPCAAQVCDYIVAVTFYMDGLAEDFAASGERAGQTLRPGISHQDWSRLMKCHVNLGHPSAKEFARLLKAAGSKPEVVKFVLEGGLECPGCADRRRPPSRLPSATPRVYDFNTVAGCDVLFLRGVTEQNEVPVINITCFGTLFSQFGIIDEGTSRRSAGLVWRAFLRLWLRCFGCPAYLVMDQGNEFLGKDFQVELERKGIQPIVIDREAPFQNGVTERRGALLKEIYYKSRATVQPRTAEEVEMLVFECSWALQTMSNRSGYSPAQRVFGRNPQLQLDLTGDGGTYDLAPTVDEAMERSAEMRRAARQALVDFDAKLHVSRAANARPRQALTGPDHQFTEGEPVQVYRKDKAGHYNLVGPCVVVVQQGSTVWVSRRGELWRCHQGQVFKMTNIDKQGLETIPKALLRAKERLRFDSEKLGYVDVRVEGLPVETLEPSSSSAAAPPRSENSRAEPEVVESSPLEIYSPSLNSPTEEPESLPLEPVRRGVEEPVLEEQTSGDREVPPQLPQGRPEALGPKPPPQVPQPAVLCSPPPKSTTEQSKKTLEAPPPPKSTTEQSKKTLGAPPPSKSTAEQSKKTPEAPPPSKSSATARGARSKSVPPGPRDEARAEPQVRPEPSGTSSDAKRAKDESGTVRRQLRTWTRVDTYAKRFRTSNRDGPSWNSVVRRVTKNLENDAVLEDITVHDKTNKFLYRELPQGVVAIETVLHYDPDANTNDFVDDLFEVCPVTNFVGTTLDAATQDTAAPTKKVTWMDGVAQMEKRLLETKYDQLSYLKKDTRITSRSRVFGWWCADWANEFGNKALNPVVANSRDLAVFKTLADHDAVYVAEEVYGRYVYLTKKSGKELNERNFSAEERRLFDQAKRAEIQVLLDSEAIELVMEPKEVEALKVQFASRFIPSRFVLTRKQMELGESWKAKARWILLGHHDPDALEVERFAPTPATTTVMLFLQLIASQRYRLTIMDVSSAFGQSIQEDRAQGPLFAYLPPTGIPGVPAHAIIRIKTAVYGLVNAPAAWRKRVRSLLVDLGYKECSFDPCLYVLVYTKTECDEQAEPQGAAGYVLLDVDDFAQGGNSRHQELMERLRTQLRFGKWREVFQSSGDYIGRTIYQGANFEIRVTMRRYIEEKLSPLSLPRARLAQRESELSAQETTLLRGIGGALLWVGREGRPDVGAACAMAMSWPKTGPTIDHICQANKVVAELKATPEVCVRILPIPLADGMWMAACDAALANAEENKSQGGFLVMFAEKKIMNEEIAKISVNSWKSHRLKRVVKASMGAEALAMDDALAELEWVRAMYTEAVKYDYCLHDLDRYGSQESVITIRLPESDDQSIIVTDARALFDHLQRQSGSSAGQDRRAQVDAAVIAASLRSLACKTSWVPGDWMLADPLTKKLGNSTLLRAILNESRYALSMDGMKALMKEMGIHSKILEAPATTSTKASWQ